MADLSPGRPGYEYAGKTVVITGATTGIGKAIGLAMGRAGAHVVVDHLDDPKGASATVDEIEAEGGSAIAVRADVSNPEAVKHLFAHAATKSGVVDFLINNASVEVNKYIWEMADDEWNAVLSSSLSSVFYCSKYVLPYMIPAGGGKIVNLSSIHDTVPRRAAGPYCASKAGLLMLTKVLSLELAPYNIQVNAVSPGVVITERTVPMWKRSPEFLRLGNKVIETNPYKRAGLVDEIVAPVMYFCSPDSGYTSGTTLYVDGAFRHNLSPASDADALPFLEKLKEKK